jgi:hypothetical protein
MLKQLVFDTEDTMIDKKNKHYFTTSAARNISFRAQVRALSEEIKRRKSLRKCKDLNCTISMQLLELKREVRYINLVRAYLRGKSYRSVERSTALDKKVSVAEMQRMLKYYLGSWQQNYHTESVVKAWIEAS